MIFLFVSDQFPKKCTPNRRFIVDILQYIHVLYSVNVLIVNTWLLQPFNFYRINVLVINRSSYLLHTPLQYKHDHWIVFRYNVITTTYDTSSLISFHFKSLYLSHTILTLDVFKYLVLPVLLSDWNILNNQLCTCCDILLTYLDIPITSIPLECVFAEGKLVKSEQSVQLMETTNDYGISHIYDSKYLVQINTCRSIQII